MRAGRAHPTDDLAVYALDALEGVEQWAVDDHLAGCARCRAELDALREAAAQLVAPADPPERVWARIAEGISRQVGSSGRRLAVVGAEPTEASGKRPVWLGRLAKPAALVAAGLVVGAIAFGAGRVQQPSGDVATGERASLTDTGGREVGHVVLDDGTGYVVLDRLDQPAESTYQLWGMDGTAPVSLGVLGQGGPAASVVPLPPGTARLAVTVEPAGGSPRPTGPVVARGALQAGH